MWRYCVVLGVGMVLGAALMFTYCRTPASVASALVQCRQDSRELLRQSVSVLSAVSKALPKVKQVPNKVMVVRAHLGEE